MKDEFAYYATAISGISQINASSTRQSWVWTAEIAEGQIPLWAALDKGRQVPGELGDDNWQLVGCTG